MKKLLLFFLFLLSYYFNCFSQGGWYSVNTPIPGLGLSKIQFPSISTGYAVGPSYNDNNSLLLKTTNKGNNWVLSSFNSVSINSLFFVNNTTGYVFGEKDQNGGIIKKTTNGGINWTNQAQGLANEFYVGYFFNANTGYVAGKYGKNYKTTDGGNTWILKYSPQIFWFDDIYFINMNTGFGIDYKIYKTTDGGDTWFVSCDDNKYYLCIHFVDSKTGFATGDGGFITKTTNAGNNWVSLGFLQLFNKSVWFVNPNTGYIANGWIDNNIFKTTNGGINWSVQNSGSGGGFLSVLFLNENTGFVCGYNGVIMKTTTGGVFVNNISSTVPDKFSLSQNYPNPFNPSTNIRFQIKDSRFVTLKVYDILGKEVASLVNEKLQAGEYEVKFEGGNLPSGIYFYKLEAGNFHEIKKMISIK